jgi:hypothetical protein
MKPEALFIADELEAPLGTVISGQLDKRAAACLRRLHATNEELLETLRWALKSYGRMLMSPKDLETEIRDAIAKAEGK